VGDDAEARLKPFLEEGVDYAWDVRSVTLPWGEVATAAMAWPRASEKMDSATLAKQSGPGHFNASNRVRDPICGMMIDPATAAGTSDYLNQTYYFCSQTCKQRFDSDPQKYVSAGGTGP
jgi:Cu+-exporting ATPase